MDSRGDGFLCSHAPFYYGVFRPFDRIVFDVLRAAEIIPFITDDVIVKSLLPDVLSRLPRYGTFAVPNDVPDRRNRAFVGAIVKSPARLDPQQQMHVIRHDVESVYKRTRVTFRFFQLPRLRSARFLSDAPAAAKTDPPQRRFWRGSAGDFTIAPTGAGEACVSSAVE